MIEATRSHKPELSGMHYSFDDRYFRYSSFSSPAHKRHLESSGYHLFKRSQTCSINSLGQVFTCPDNYHCIGDSTCERDNSWYDSDNWRYWCGGGIGVAIIVALVILISVRRRRIQRQQEALGQPPVVVHGYGHEEQYGYPIAMEPLRQAVTVYPGATRVLYAPPTTPPPHVPVSSPVFTAAAVAVPTNQSDLYGASGSSSASSAPPEYSPPQDSHEPSMMKGGRKN
ncbi:hypothetical protein BGX21_006138 [Mortierella sp. AD011]|nr:hypothetical protein BGX20_006584 [Mortierella sp. AD010]KAF9399507.1 hypothetical protein BGX21_006138 [Mortierella sp. AD011]